VQYNQDEGIVDVDCLGLKKVRCWEENGYSYIEAKLLVRYITICGEKLAEPILISLTVRVLHVETAWMWSIMTGYYMISGMCRDEKVTNQNDEPE